jgi:hypothetical protein
MTRLFNAAVLTAVLFSTLYSVLFSAAAWARIEKSTKLGFVAEQQMLAQLDGVQHKAASEQKLLLLVLGAQWCHDSVALMQQFSEPKLSTALSEKFELAFVDVGFLQFGQATTARYQLPLYYGTPTVMIIAPDSGQLLNKTDLMRWSNAASFDKQTYWQYFIETDFQQQFAKEQQQMTAVSTVALKQITDFEQQQAAKLLKAYQQLGPLLQAYKTSGKPATDEFQRAWDEVATMRNRILPDVQQLQKQATTLAPGQSLRLPRYPPFRFVSN